MAKKCDFMDKCQRRHNILIFSIEECSRETYFATLKTIEDILGLKLKVDVSNCHIESVRRLERIEKTTNFGQIRCLYEEIGSVTCKKDNYKNK